MQSARSVVLGRVLGAFGIHGWVRVKPFTETFDGLIDQPVWTLQLRSTTRTMQVEELKPHSGALLAKLAGIDDRNEAEALRGADVTIGREKLPAADEGEYYWNDLIGLIVRNVRGVELGRITGLIAAPAHDVLRVQGGSNDGDPPNEQLIPFVEPIVHEVDVPGGSVTVDWEADY